VCDRGLVLGAEVGEGADELGQEGAGLGVLVEQGLQARADQAGPGGEGGRGDGDQEQVGAVVLGEGMLGPGGDGDEFVGGVGGGLRGLLVHLVESFFLLTQNAQQVLPAGLNQVGSGRHLMGALPTNKAGYFVNVAATKNRFG